MSKPKATVKHRAKMEFAPFGMRTLRLCGAEGGSVEFNRTLVDCKACLKLLLKAGKKKKSK